MAKLSASGFAGSFGSVPCPLVRRYVSATRESILPLRLGLTDVYARLLTRVRGQSKQQFMRYPCQTRHHHAARHSTRSSDPRTVGWHGLDVLSYRLSPFLVYSAVQNPSTNLHLLMLPPLPPASFRLPFFFARILPCTSQYQSAMVSCAFPLFLI